MDFWCQNGRKLAPTWDQKLMFNWEGDFSKIVLWLQRGLDLSGSGGPSWEQKSIKNRSKNGIQDGMHLGIDFSMILVDFGCQLGGKMDQKSIKNRIEKTMQKTKPFGTRLGPSSGRQGGRDVLRPSTARPGALEILPRRPPGPPPFRAKIPVKKETVLDVLTRLGPEARRIFLKEKPCFLRSSGLKLEAKTDQKSIKNCNSRWSASWH